MAEQIPSVGRIVHYVLHEGRSKGEHRPALILRTFGHEPRAMVNLVVFQDGLNDNGVQTPQGPVLLAWATSVTHAEAQSHEPGTWHWPEYVPGAG